MPKFSWHDRFAMIIALYKIVLPQMLLMIGVAVLAVWLLLTFWLN